MTSEAELLEMIEKATHIKVGVQGSGLTYFNITHQEAIRKADEIAAFGLVVEFGHECMADTLYIEAPRRVRGSI